MMVRRLLVSALLALVCLPAHAELATVAAGRVVRAVTEDAPAAVGPAERVSEAVGADWVRTRLGYDGSGVTVAVIDSGVMDSHDDLSASRIARFVDFVNFQPAAYDDYGHGTHVAGILAGNGSDSSGSRRGIAPAASLLVEKVLDETGQGYISNVIAAIDYAIANRDTLGVRVINLSVAALVTESYLDDPLALAAKRAVDAGIVVVTAAGNLGRNAGGQTQYGGIGSPGNAPWVVTVGASAHSGSRSIRDDIVAPFSSRGPTAIDSLAKPDLVAPGVSIESLADPSSTLFLTKPAARVWGTVTTASQPYLSLTGTSMASPVVSGTIALMLQANPSLTPNLVKAILEYTAETHAGYDALTEGAGFLNARGAVEAAATLAATGSVTAAGQTDPTAWSGHVIWGNQRVAVRSLQMSSPSWRADVTWGADTATGRRPQ
ncbi:MAG TPA: S8 family peptidase [Vicinamibacterales bacterium]|jgi:serine protease AprX|nr:S8 family peptidase [Vicinamibacterales bacterium]